MGRGVLGIVRAGAGSGKTWEVTRWLAEQVVADVDPASILATTFTRKAAAELKDRIQARLLACDELPKGMEQFPAAHARFLAYGARPAAKPLGRAQVAGHRCSSKGLHRLAQRTVDRRSSSVARRRPPEDPRHPLGHLVESMHRRRARYGYGAPPRTVIAGTVDLVSCSEKKGAGAAEQLVGLQDLQLLLTYPFQNK